jgi:hypothetical protein
VRLIGTGDAPQYVSFIMVAKLRAHQRKSGVRLHQSRPLGHVAKSDLAAREIRKEIFCRCVARYWRARKPSVDQSALLIIPAPTVTPVASSIRMKEPVVRFFE